MDHGVRPYELPRPKYALWYDVLMRCGELAGAAVLGAFSNGHRLYTSDLISGQEIIIQSLAKKRGVLLHIVE